jgi:hypothetical protein
MLNNEVSRMTYLDCEKKEKNDKHKHYWIGRKT